jgi:enamine deaminase RidA (YjgF/YER057c/UK114 family)
MMCLAKETAVIERLTVSSLAPSPGYAHVAVASGRRLVVTAGANGEDVLKTTVYVASTDRSDLVAVWDVVLRSPLAAAASTLLGVAALGYTDQLVEIEAIAAIAESGGG